MKQTNHIFKLQYYSNNTGDSSSYALDNTICLFTALLRIPRNCNFVIKESSHIFKGDHSINYASQASVSDCCEF